MSRQIYNQILRFLSKRSKGPVCGTSKTKARASAKSKTYKLLTFLVGIPLVGLQTANCYYQIMEHPKERPEFIPYEHLRIRNKRFPWGDGQKSFFHNPHVNALPDGYEDEKKC